VVGVVAAVMGHLHGGRHWEWRGWAAALRRGKGRGRDQWSYHHGS
jgi:hypothetical protein